MLHLASLVPCLAWSSPLFCRVLCAAWKKLPMYTCFWIEKHQPFNLKKQAIIGRGLICSILMLIFPFHNQRKSYSQNQCIICTLLLYTLVCACHVFHVRLLLSERSVLCVQKLFTLLIISGGLVHWLWKQDHCVFLWKADCFIHLLLYQNAVYIKKLL